jgi:DNA-binding transcriptional ArsR family regulator
MPRMAAGRPTDTPSSGGAPASARTAVFATLLEHYPTVQYHYVQFLADHLTDCRKTLGGDFDDLMLLAVLGQRFLQARQDSEAGDSSAAERVWMSALRIADVTGVPRESVRRKLKRLAERGWVTQDKERGWAMAGSFEVTQARIDLADLDRRGLERLGKLIAALMPLLSVGQTVPTEAGKA